jgi:hypothetical protein
LRQFHAFAAGVQADKFRKRAGNSQISPFSTIIIGVFPGEKPDKAAQIN